MAQAYSKQGLYFKKDKRAMIYKRCIGGKDQNGFMTDEYYIPVAPAPLWCYSRQLTQDQLYAAHAFMNGETRLFVFNNRDDVKQADYIYYITKDQWYKITRVDTTDDYRGELFTYAANLNQPPKEKDIKPYGYEPPGT